MINVVNKRVFKGENGFYIGRGSSLGNPFSHKQGTKADYVVDSVEDAVIAYEGWLFAKVFEQDEAVCGLLNKLYKHYKTTGELNLVCYCKWQGNEPCHGDVIKKILETKL